MAMQTISMADGELIAHVLSMQDASATETELADRLHRALDEVDALEREMAEPRARTAGDDQSDTFGVFVATVRRALRAASNPTEDNILRARAALDTCSGSVASSATMPAARWRDASAVCEVLEQMVDCAERWRDEGGAHAVLQRLIDEAEGSPSRVQ